MSSSLTFPLVALLTGTLLSACVVGASAPPDHAAAARGVTARPPGKHSAVTYLRGARPAPNEPPADIRRGERWVRGYFHWSGVDYVWVPGHLERTRVPYARR